MALYRIYPSKDAFISSETPKANTGLDEILEISGYYDTSATGRTNRSLVQFSTAEINSVLSDTIGNNAFETNLHLYLAEAYEIPKEFSMEAYPVYGSWDEGIGKYFDIPLDTSGVSWTFRKSKEEANWLSGSLPSGVTFDYGTGQLGGGTWYTGSNGISLASSQSYDKFSDHDIDLPVDNAIQLFTSGTIENNGFLLKMTGSLEFSTSASLRLKYYSSETHTIYRPYLEFRWDDSSYNTGSLGSVSSNPTITVKNNTGEYYNVGKQRFRLSARPKYPVRTFTTSSVYLVNYALPSSATWAIKDELSNEMIMDFHPTYTKVSSDSTGNYFDVYMDCFYPERYYRILVKSEIDGSITVFDTNAVFKVVQHV